LEDYAFLAVQAIEALAMSLMIGLVFFDLKLDQLSARDRFGLLYIIGALYPYMVILDVIGKCQSVFTIS
jgi:ATP-binding cassette subfamily G (WHITE) protein 8 (sterolin 2)